MAVKLEQLRVLIAVADNGGFVSAAAELGCTQSRISHAIDQLEHALEVRLLERSRKGSVPTAAGYRVLDKARHMLRLEQDLVSSANEQDALKGRVRVACIRGLGTHLLPYAAEVLAAMHPGIVLDIYDSGNRLQVTQAVRERIVDLAIAQLPVGRHLECESYLQDDYVLVTPAARKLPIPFDPTKLDTLPFIRFDCPGTDEVVARCRAVGFNARSELAMTSCASIVAMIARGMGYSILPRLAVYPGPDEVHMTSLPIPARRQFALVGYPDTLRTPHVRAVLRLLRDHRMLMKTPAYQAKILRWN